MNNSSKNHYEVLGVSSDASDEEIKRAFHDYAKDNHPDRNPENEDSEQLFKRAVLAYETLKDPLRRQAFDEAIAFDRKKRRTRRRQGRRLLMLFALLLLAPSALFLSLFVSGDQDLLESLGFLPEAITTYQTSSGNSGGNSDNIAETSVEIARGNSASLDGLGDEALSGRGGGALRNDPRGEFGGTAAARSSLPDNVGSVSRREAAYQSVPEAAQDVANLHRVKPAVAEPAQSPIPEQKVAELTPPEIVLSVNVDISGPFSDCNICPLMFIPKRTIAGIDGTNHAISMSEITISQWEDCTNDGACPAYERGTARKTEPVTGMDKEAADNYAAWLTRITGQTYAALMPKAGKACNTRSNRFSSNRWDWMRSPSGEGCETPGGFRVSRQIESES